jgi:hypothetical protein
MSDQLELPGFTGRGSGNRTPAEVIRASIGREILYLLTISRDASRGYRITPAGVAHSLGVCLIEDWNVARGARKGKEPGIGQGVPTFVDVKLDDEERENFLAWLGDDVDALRVLQAFTDQSYRVGVAWSGEHQTYTCSVTCRDPDSSNNGLCMTSFSRVLTQAILLAWYKHDVMCQRDWAARAPKPTEGFG